MLVEDVVAANDDIVVDIIKMNAIFDMISYVTHNQASFEPGWVLIVFLEDFGSGLLEFSKRLVKGDGQLDLPDNIHCREG